MWMLPHNLLLRRGSTGSRNWIQLLVKRELGNLPLSQYELCTCVCQSCLDIQIQIHSLATSPSPSILFINCGQASAGIVKIDFKTALARVKNIQTEKDNLTYSAWSKNRLKIAFYWAKLLRLLWHTLTWAVSFQAWSCLCKCRHGIPNNTVMPFLGQQLPIGVKRKQIMSIFLHFQVCQWVTLKCNERIFVKEWTF